MNIIIVDENDNQIGVKERSALDPMKDIYRVASLWLFDGKGDILLTKHSTTKERYSDLWTCAVAGTVEEGETYESNIVKEIKEELGTSDIHPIIEKKRFHEAPHPHFTQRFHAVCDLPVEAFTLDPNEAQEARWWTWDEIEQTLKKQPEIFTPMFAKHAWDFLTKRG